MSNSIHDLDNSEWVSLHPGEVGSGSSIPYSRPAYWLVPQNPRQVSTVIVLLAVCDVASLVSILPVPKPDIASDSRWAHRVLARRPSPRHSWTHSSSQRRRILET